MAEKTCLYDIVLNGEVVYVGVTNDPKKRYSSHRSNGNAPEGSKLVIHKWYSDRTEALAAEYARQMELKPIFCRESYFYGPDMTVLHKYTASDGCEKYCVACFSDWQNWHDTRLTAKQAIDQSIDHELKNASPEMWASIFGARKEIRIT